MSDESGFPKAHEMVLLRKEYGEIPPGAQCKVTARYKVALDREHMIECVRVGVYGRYQNKTLHFHIDFFREMFISNHRKFMGKF